MGNTEGRDGSSASSREGGLAKTHSQQPQPSAAFSANDKHIRLELDIQKDRMGKLIGTGGKTIREIQQRTPNIQFRTPAKDDVTGDDYKFVPVILVGRAQDVFKAALMVDDVAIACLAVLTVQVQPRDIGLLQRESIINLKQEIAIDTLRLPKRTDKPPRVVIEGFLEDVVRAYHQIHSEVEKAAKMVVEEREMGKLMAISKLRLGGEGGDDGAVDGKGMKRSMAGVVAGAGQAQGTMQEKRSIGASGMQVDEFQVSPNEARVLIGPRGETLYALKQRTGALIQVSQNNGKVRIEGQPALCHRARMEIDRMLGRQHNGKLEDYQDMPLDNPAQGEQSLVDGMGAAGRSFVVGQPSGLH